MEERNNVVDEIQKAQSSACLVLALRELMGFTYLVSIQVDVASICKNKKVQGCGREGGR
jgi:hypothetical protein